MGKRKEEGSGDKKAYKKSKKDVWQTEGDLVRESKAFEDYYRLQQIVPEEEFDAFMSVLKTDLPVTFRISELHPLGPIVRERLQTHFQFPGTVEFEGKQIACVHPIPWYPDNNAWEVDVHRRKLRKIEAFQELHKYIVELTEEGVLCRQESVSMLPPLFLQAEPDDRVLDLCAAPGSKTMQLLERVHGGRGVVVANDANERRARMLINQTSRLLSPRLAVTSHLGQEYPALPLPFDKVLCDVPCSGDGTLRKTPELWAKWSGQYALALHPLQVAIALRGLQLLRVGGRMVYSTCSLNPVEDEAVVAELLRRCAGRVRLVDASGLLPGLRRARGLHHWKVVDEANHPFEAYEAVPDKLRALYRRSMFPPAAAEAEAAHLERCMRVLPHQQNSGGFFLCVLEKTGALESSLDGEKGVEVVVDSVKGEAAMDSEKDVEAIDSVKGEAAIDSEKSESRTAKEASDGLWGHEELHGIVRSEQQSLGQAKKKDALVRWADPSLRERLTTFYGIDGAFDWDALFVRESSAHTLYLVASQLRALCGETNKDLNLLHTGLPCFVQNARSGPCGYRLAYDGLTTTLECFHRRVVKVLASDVLDLIREKQMPIASCSASLQEAIRELEEGSCVFVLKKEECDRFVARWGNLESSFKSLFCVVWKGIATIHVMTNESVLTGIRRLLTLE